VLVVRSGRVEKSDGGEGWCCGFGRGESRELCGVRWFVWAVESFWLGHLFASRVEGAKIFDGRERFGHAVVRATDVYIVMEDIGAPRGDGTRLVAFRAKFYESACEFYVIECIPNFTQAVGRDK